MGETGQESGQEPDQKFHPVIEENVETSGEYKGTMKDTELTRNAANVSNEMRNYSARVAEEGEEPMTAERHDVLTDAHIRTKLQDEAQDRSPLNKKIRAAADATQPGIKDITLDDYRNAIDERKAVGEDYDRLQREAEANRVKREIEGK
jgi:hypothetical protein